MSICRLKILQTQRRRFGWFGASEWDQFAVRIRALKIALWVLLTIYALHSYLSIVRALSQNSYLKMQLLLEMCARTIKCKLLEELRKTKKKKRYSLNEIQIYRTGTHLWNYRVFALEPYHEVVLDIFNLILGNNDNLEKASGIFWNNIR